MSLDVRDHVRCCRVCQLYKPKTPKPPGKLQQTVVTSPWEMLGVDLMGPFPQSSLGNLYLLVFVDYNTRWEEMFSLHTATAETVSNILKREILTRWDLSLCLPPSRKPVHSGLCSRKGVTVPPTDKHDRADQSQHQNNNCLLVEDRHKNSDKHLPECSSAGID